MKRIAIWIMISAFALSLAACAAGKTDESIRVKCPSCGYQFDIDDHGQG